MQKTELPIEQTGFFTDQIVAYSKNDERLKSFYQYTPKVESVLQAIEKRNQFPFFRNELVTVLKEQYKKIDEVNFNSTIEKLLLNNAYTVTTAHQPNLLLGPLYTIYKAISAINTAELLSKKYSQNIFVPVFWLGSEDHDVDELAHFNLNGRKWEWSTEQQGAFGRMTTRNLLPLLDELYAALGNSEQAAAIKNLIQKCFNGSATIAEATQHLLHLLLGKFGLIVLDADDSRLKKIFSEVMMEEIIHQPSEKIVNETGEQLQPLFKPQAQPRPINLFYLDDAGRNRIEKSDEGFIVANSNRKFSEQEILLELKNFPEKFSPNVILRPLYQEMILPNVMFIGGGAEINYFSQLKNLFQHFKIHFPICMLRNSATIIDAGVSRKLEQAEIAVNEIFLPADVLIRKFISKQNRTAYNLETEKTDLLKVLEQIKQKVADDKGLLQTTETECARLLKSFEQLEEKFLRAAKKKEEVNVDRIKQMKEKLFPQNHLQERFDNWMKFYLVFGERWIDVLKENFTPFSFSYTIISDNQMT